MADSRGPMRNNSGQPQTRLSASNREKLLAGYANGVRVLELSARSNIYRATVREIARCEGHRSRAPEHSEQVQTEAARLYGEGLTLSQVAGQLEIDDEAVRSAVIACGGAAHPRDRRRVVN